MATEPMDLRQRVAPLLVVRASGYLSDGQRRYPRWELANAELQRLLAAGVGGVILLGASAAELGQRTTVAVSSIGKVKTGFQMTAIGMLIWQQPFLGLPIYQIGYVCLFAAAALTVWSMAVYLRAAWPYLKESMPQ